MSVAIVLGAALALAGCSKIGGGESGAKWGPFNTNPKAKPGRGKFKGYAKCVSLETGEVRIAILGGIPAALAYAAAEEPETTLLPPWPPVSQDTAPEAPDAQLAGGGGEGGIRCSVHGW
jgi:hypothetical protein